MLVWTNYTKAQYKELLLSKENVISNKNYNSVNLQQLFKSEYLNDNNSKTEVLIQK